MKTSILALLIFTTMSANSGCINEEHPGYEYFQIKVDTISAPESVIEGDTITFILNGFVGSDGCYAFSHFKEVKNPLVSKVTVMGIHRKNSICTQAIVMLRDKEYKVKVYLAGDYQLVIRQPDGTELHETVRVLEK